MKPHHVTDNVHPWNLGGGGGGGGGGRKERWGGEGRRKGFKEEEEKGKAMQIINSYGSMLSGHIIRAEPKGCKLHHLGVYIFTQLTAF